MFRSEWLTDIVYFLSTHLPIQITTFLILLPATQLSSVLNIPVLTRAVGHLPWIVQFFLAVLVADLAEYAIHRAFHKVPFMWRFHAIHHSSKSLDWIAGSRSHIVDDVAVRGFILIPMMCVFSHNMLVAYLFFVNIHATWAHCNYGPTMASAMYRRWSRSATLHWCRSSSTRGCTTCSTVSRSRKRSRRYRPVMARSSPTGPIFARWHGRHWRSAQIQTRPASSCWRAPTARVELEKDGIAVSEVYPFITATNFGKNRMSNSAGGGPPASYADGDKPEFVAGLVVKAIEEGQAQYFANDRLRQIAGISS